jgi:serine/threonine-protein kinase
MMVDPALARLQQALRGRYTVRSELGRGGTALVFLAHDLKHDRPVALKVLRPEIAVALGADRFVNEIRLAAKLQHPHILPLFDSGEADGWLYYVMPHIEGPSLRQRIEQERQLPLDEALRIFQQVSGALDYAHGEGIVHRDIKPDNILLSVGHSVVADFGIAQAITAAGGERLTETGIVVGTPAYMSPEQGGGAARLDGRADVYSLGCVVYEMLAGEPPFTGPNTQAVLARHALDPVPPLRTVRKAVPEHVEQAVRRALEKVPADRFPTAADFAAAVSAPIPVRRRAWSGRKTALVAAAVVLLGAAGWLAVSARGAGVIRSIAVLPLDNLTGDSAQDVFVDGMHEALIAELAQIEALKIISRTSTLRYRGSDKAVPVIARELGVDAVVEGSVFRAGDSVRVTAQLIDGRTDRHVWAETNVRDLRDVLRLHGELAAAIAERVRIVVTPAERRRLADARQVDPDVWSLALKGQYECGRWTEAGFRRGIRMLLEAVDRDPTYAFAFASLAGCYSDIVFFGYEPPATYNPLAKDAIERALALDSTVGEVHAILGWIRFVTEVDFRGPDRDFRRALELSPGSALVHDWYADYLTLTGRFDDAIARKRRGIELDPLAVNKHVGLGWTYFKARRYSESIAQLQHALELEPGYSWAYMELAWNYAQTGMAAAAGAHCDSAFARAPQQDDVVMIGSCGWVYGLAGRTPKAEEMLRLLRALAQRRWLDPIHLASVYVGLGDLDRALEAVRHAVRDASPSLVFLKVDPWFDPLRSDPRFRALTEELGIDS